MILRRREILRHHRCWGLERYCGVGRHCGVSEVLRDIEVSTAVCVSRDIEVLGLGEILTWCRETLRCQESISYY